MIYPNNIGVPLLPTSIGILTACLRKNNIDIYLFDTTLFKTETKNIDTERSKLLQFKPFDLSKKGIVVNNNDVYNELINKVAAIKPDLIGITLVDDTTDFGLSLLNKIKCHFDIPTIAGGISVTFSPEEYLCRPEIDYICYGEGEYALPELCNCLQNNQPTDNIDNIWSKKTVKNGSEVETTLIKTHMRSLVNINEIPYCDYSLFSPERFYRPMSGKIYKMLPIEIDRGCPYKCKYCGSPALDKIYHDNTGCHNYRKKTMERIFDEMKYRVDKYKIEYVYFNSDTFLAMNDKKFETFASRYIDEINLPFWCQSRIETISEKKIDLLTQMGCDRMSIGLEHGNEKFRKEVLGKKFTNSQVINAFEILNRYPISVTANNMIGFPDETRELIFDTINLNRQIKPDTVSVYTFVPYRGTELRQICINKGYITESARSDTLINTTLNMPQISKEELQGLLRTFPLYIKFDEDRFDEIKIAESYTEEGNIMYDKLSKEYMKRYWDIT